MKARLFLATWTIALLAAPFALAGDWPQFRGPGANGVVGEKSLPTEWSKDKNIAWKVNVPGVAWSSPIVWGDRIYVTTAITENQPKPRSGGGYGGGGRFGRRGGPGGGERPDGPTDRRPDAPARDNPGADRATDPERGPDAAPPAKQPDEPNPSGDRSPGGPRRGPGGFRPGGPGGPGGFGRSGPPNAVYKWQVLCLDRNTGQTIWSQTAAEHKPAIPTHSTNTYASETPVTDGERVYAYFGMTGLYCYDSGGKLLWKKDLGAYPMMMGWGTGSSPILAGDLLVIQCDNEQKSFLVAFDKNSGEEKWRDERDERSTWATPYLWKNKVRTEIVTAGGKKARSYDPATGKILWELSGISGRCAATPVGDDEMVYFGTGGGMGVGPLVAVKAGASGDIPLSSAKSEGGAIAWVAPNGGPPMASPLLYQGLLYVFDQRGGVLSCYNAKTGEVAYKQRIPGATGFTASPWAAEGKIYCTDGDGVTHVLQSGPEFKVLAKNPLEEMCWSSPALADGTLFLRTVDNLYCIKP